ncbi:membrane protein DedA with SNARE-associated domain [Naumannella cuiyingiana]|uniref:Membrane protein DedA with SNARE-associated domain n=1 Tax=Naumannella cuiyingiana TaxID=1347891 RepID=A0A7Z0D9V3_9ACTN|nr:VTT domain-containing protein [Naumannella cuiyingiana]NYI71639.1 membrane protein DedA with SNARE-associated domain [Naumannella cuiyingiana]
MTQRPDEPEDPERSAADAADAAGSEPGEAAEAELEWWQYPGLPFRSKPGRLDYICMFGIIAAGVYSLALTPFRVWLLTNVPYVLVALSGSGSALVGIGAAIHIGDTWWPLAAIIGALSAIKFDWLFWLAGRLWGEGMIDWLLGGAAKQNAGWLSRTRRKIALWSHRLAQRWAIPMILLTYVPVLPIPSAIVFGALGMGGMRLRTFLIIDFLCSLANRALYLYLGYRIGLPVLEVLEELNKWSLWIGLGLVAVIVFFAFRNASKADVTVKSSSKE